MRRVLWVFAHQDDELAAAARIVAARANGDEVWCAFLTDGAARVPAHVRNEESVKALAQLGVSRDTIVFDGSVPDGQLLDHLDASLERLERRLEGIHFDEVGCLAWEGGHHDHDASHMIAVAFARRRGIEAYEVPLYNGGGPLFRVLRAVGRGWEAHDVSLREGLRIIGLVRFYKSQTRTWLALFPEAWFRLVVLRRTHARRVDAKRLHDAPHEGRLFYERRFRVPRERFLRAAAPFLARHFEATTKQCPVCDGHRFARRQLLPDLAVDRCEGCGLRTSEVEEQVREIVLDEEPAERISTAGVLEHLPPHELSKFAQDVARRAKVWAIQVPSAEGLYFRIAHALLPFTRGVVRRLWQPEHARPRTVYFDRATLTRFLERHGFTVEEVRDAADPARPATPLVRLVSAVERWRGKSDALLVIARSARR